MEVKIRKYTKSDAKALLALYYYTVHATNIKDYNPDQVNAWAPTATEGIGSWNERLIHEKAVVAEAGNTIVGFGTLHDKGKSIGMLYVNPDFQGKGVGKALLKKLEKKIKKKGEGETTVEVSITARPFFESRGYHWVRDNKKMLNVAEFLNYIMEKNLMAKKDKEKKKKNGKGHKKSHSHTIIGRVFPWIFGK